MGQEIDHETWLRERIREIAERARQEAQPYVDQLVMLESLKPPRPIFIPVDPDALPYWVKELAAYE
tara:strand:+ start:283 stop:480 length:198 start_codon:yes stop_codon:yes gene_type:complete